MSAYSRYLRTQSRDGIVAVFHELHPNPVFIYATVWHTARRNSDNLPIKIRRQFLYRKLIATPKEDQSEFSRAESNLTAQLNYPSVLYLILTQTCNLNCTYCPFSSSSHADSSMMSLKTIGRALDFWASQIKNRDSTAQHTVIFYGGEALLNRATLLEGLRYLRSLQKTGRLPRNTVPLLATNGLLIDKTIIKVLKKYDVTTVVGCDGPAESNDSFRRDANDQPTFAAIDRILHQLIAAGVRTSASVSITPYNIKHIKEYTSFFTSYNLTSFGFNFLRGKRLLEILPSNHINQYFNDAADGIIKNYTTSNKPTYEHQMARRHIAFYQRQYFPVECGGYGSQIVVQPKGQIGNCPFMNTILGSVDRPTATLPMHRHTITQQWRQRLPLHNPACRRCSAKSICSGGCPWSTLQIDHNFQAIDPGVCHLSKKAFRSMIWSKQL